jgi:ferredoxin
MPKVPFFPMKPKNTPINLSGSVIDFHAPEFNAPDDLNDWTGNYRSFQPLGDIITADMRHQMARRNNRSERDPFEESSKDFPEKAQENHDALIEPPEPLPVISGGRLLLVDTDLERALALAGELNEKGLICTPVITSRPSEKPSFSEEGNTDFHIGDGVTISGVFGNFSAAWAAGDRHPSLTTPLIERPPSFDLVLDLQPRPSYAGEILPLGYYATGGEASDLAQAMAELPEMRGRFLRPRFTSLLKERCFHGRLRGQDCRRCLAACPFDALQSIKNQVAIDPFLCQGCGACTLVCPSEAFILHKPSRDESIRGLQSLMNKDSNPHGPPITLVLRYAGLGENSIPPLLRTDPAKDRLCLEFESGSLMGLDIFLAALAFGAREILIPWDPRTWSHIGKILEFQVEMGRAILRGLGWDMDRIRLIEKPSNDRGRSLEASFTGGRLINYSDHHPAFMSSPFHPTPNADKRSLILQSARHLFDSSPVQDPTLPLPEGAPFGTVVLDKKVCTLCLACASACPSGALSAGGSTPRLLFQESLCHQCGLCQAACPESALRLVPRLLCDPPQVQSHQVLQEAEPFRCIACGRPFAPPAMIHHIQEKLQGHWMFTEPRQLRRLQMCRTCRARDALTSSDWRLWNQS